MAKEEKKDSNVSEIETLENEIKTKKNELTELKNKYTFRGFYSKFAGRKNVLKHLLEENATDEQKIETAKSIIVDVLSEY